MIQARSTIAWSWGNLSCATDSTQWRIDTGSGWTLSVGGHPFVYV